MRTPEEGQHAASQFLSFIYLKNLSDSHLKHSHHQLHMYFFPIMAPGHVMPLTDMFRQFTRRNMGATIAYQASRECAVSRRHTTLHYTADKLVVIGFSFVTTHTDCSPEFLRSTAISLG
ncbi:hypothetical protein HAX54_033746 [Datura stramonium]|uniref:Uncharacterized protein n=1 Tax=Datura stramonium TaxID=4076 RepID=A0ABS8VCZ8_DATST|nr:hypothetical protein [Datura stramonium]